MRNAVITGWGKCVPPAVLSNADLETVTETSDEWIVTRTGIRERRISHVETSDMAAVAGLRALATAGLEPDDIDLILVATCTPDRLIPSTAAIVQDKIGAGRAAAMDLNAACSGFIFGLVTARQMIGAGGFERVLLIGAEKLHYFLDFTDRSTSVLFGDGAGAVVLEGSDEDAGVRSFELGTDGSVADILCVPRSGTEGAPGPDRRMVVHMEGAEVFRRAVAAMGDASTRVIEEAGLELDDIDLLIPHQANIRIIEATARRLRLHPSKVFVNIASYGNTSAATIPIALTEAIDEGRITPGSNIVFAAFGGGLTWAAAVYRWGSRIEPLGSSDADLPPSDASGLELMQPNIDLYGMGVQ
ncbi:MAG: ketoacyl-ACP synthase III [Actinobacteria bacterium]|nr:ketoacyl-ACP synthase III [Actinomycetota bacterium]MBU1493279.1 ketoacyl-ACP synthase III [Actinomycetota bacterium]MBU1866673.1 ketoacyl-ACP synthase III [Actinomycetota bacterium]